jgi:biopolymer transport protein TolR
MVKLRRARRAARTFVSRKSRRTGVAPDINVTPLVDVVLVLLIIFMVVTPKMEAGKTVSLPQAESTDKKTSMNETPSMLSVTASGELYFDDDLVTKEALAEKLGAMKKGGSSKRLVIKADEQAAYNDVMRVFKACETAGFEGVALQVRAKEGRKG